MRFNFLGGVAGERERERELPLYAFWPADTKPEARSIHISNIHPLFSRQDTKQRRAVEPAAACWRESFSVANTDQAGREGLLKFNRPDGDAPA